MVQVLLTIACAFVVGKVLDRLKVPGGMMIGAVIGACGYSIFTSNALVPGEAKTIAQIIAGAYIGAGVSRKEVKEMRAVVKPALIVLSGLLLLNIVTGFILYNISSMDLLTSLMCCTPGGISDIPMIAADMGADPSKVVAMQFVRLILGIGVFPMMIGLVTGTSGEHGVKTSVKTKKEINYLNVLITCVVATVCGIVGKLSPVPAGTMAFATLGSIIFSCTTERAQLPRIFRKGAQLLSGAYVGASIGIVQIRELIGLWPSALVLVAAYTIACFVIGFILTKAKCFNPTEAMLAATPAGASDMALISADLGVHNAKLIVLQVLRLITVVLVFPSIMSLIVQLVAR